MQDSILRESLARLLREGRGHVSIERTLDGIKPELRNVRSEPQLHSIWDNLEHIRRVQESLLRWTLDPTWQQPDYPGGLWPVEAETLTEETWSASVSGFFSDLEELVDMVNDTSLDLTTKVPHSKRATYLDQALLGADHNTYHLSQIVLVRKTLGNWG